MPLAGSSRPPRSASASGQPLKERDAVAGSSSGTRAFRDLVLDAPAPSLAEAPVQALLTNAAIDLMPEHARRLHGLSPPFLPPVIRRATLGVAQTLRWAFAGENYRAVR